MVPHDCGETQRSSRKCKYSNSQVARALAFKLVSVRTGGQTYKHVASRHIFGLSRVMPSSSEVMTAEAETAATGRAKQEMKARGDRDSVSSSAPTKPAPQKRSRKAEEIEPAPEKRVKTKSWTEQDEAKIVRHLIEISGIQTLAANGEGVNDPDSNAETCLHLAAEENNIEAIRWLISKKADINIQDSEGMTPLARCVATCSKCAKTLVNAGADVNLQFGSNASMQASVKLLLEQRAIVNVFDSNNGVAPLHDACFGGSVETVTLLGVAPLHFAAQQNHPEVVELLVKKGANVNRANAKGRTALHYAAHSGADEAIEMLLKCGADPAAKDSSNRTPLDYASEKNHLTAQAVLGHSGVLQRIASFVNRVVRFATNRAA